MVPPIKLARTGIEQVFCSDRPRFIDNHREFERVATVNVSKNNEYLFAVAPLFLYPPFVRLLLRLRSQLRHSVLLISSNSVIYLTRSPLLHPTGKVYKRLILDLTASKGHSLSLATRLVNYSKHKPLTALKLIFGHVWFKITVKAASAFFKCKEG